MAFTQRGSVIESPAAWDSFYFGSAVALSSDAAVLAAGSRGSTLSVPGSGSVYCYAWSGGAWSQRGSELLASDQGSYDAFGTAVALSADGSVLAVGAPKWDGGALDQGGVYLFDWDGSAWVQRGSVLVASDAAASDLFGSAVALSSDGSVLAVGATGWEGGASGQGGVYLYDWNSGAWVQRGSVLVAADAASGDAFGAAVALSSDGGVLAVGASGWEGAVTGQGGVYLYDWNSGAASWDARGSVLTASDAGDGDAFGIAVALSDSGAVLAVGAKYWDAGASNQGAVYLFDWDGSAWTERAGALTAGDAGASDYFGGAVALSGDAGTLAVGADSWDGASYTDDGAVYVFDSNSGAAAAPTALTVEVSTGVALAPTSLSIFVPETGAALAQTRLDISESGAAAAPTALTVSWPSGAAGAATRLDLSATGRPAAPTALALTTAGHHPLWTARCILDGADVSAQLAGVIQVTADEGAARIATLTLRPAAGVIAPLDYVGKTVSLDYVQLIDGASVSRRLFTGRIDTPIYDPNSTLLQLDCVDDLQNRVAALDRSVIDALVGGRYTVAVQGELDDNWDYAQARLETVSSSLDAGAAGELRVTPWQIGTTWATLGDGDLLYQRSSLTLPQRSSLINRVDIEFSYRYPRLRQRFSNIAWSGTVIEMEKCGYQYPTQSDILGAAGGTGWTPVLGVFYPAPASIPHTSGGFVIPADDAIDMAIVYMAQRHSQTVTERYAVSVSAPESVTSNGELPRTLRGALSSSFDGNAWESALDVEPLLPDGGDIDHAPDAPRADSDYALQTLLDQANVLILGSHRSARVGNAVLCNPDLDLDKRIAINASGMSVDGKVASVVHTLDLDAGSAVSEFELACSGVGGAGIITPDSLEPPAPPEEAAETQDWLGGFPSLMVNVYGVTPYQDGLMGLLINPPATYTVHDVPTPDGPQTQSVDNPHYVAGSYPITGFRVQMPGVDDADRNPIEKTVTASYAVVIPSDTLSFTVP